MPFQRSAVLTVDFPIPKAPPRVFAGLAILPLLALPGCYHPHIVNDQDAIYCEGQGLPRGTDGNIACARKREAEEEEAGIHHPQPEPGETPVAPQALQPPIRPGGVSQITDVTVAPGGTTTIGFFFSLNADCSLAGLPEVRIEKPPAHGTTETLQRLDFPRFVQSAMPANCAPKKVPGVALDYTASGEYDGKDSLEFETITQAGIKTHYKVPITIKTPELDDGS